MRKDLEAILDSLPAQPPRSRLDPYADLIEEMRRRNWTYRAIAEVLAEKCDLKVAPSNIHHFVRQRELRMASKPETVRKVDAGDRQSAASASRSRSVDKTGGSIKEQDDEVRARIDALKRRQEPRNPARKAFEFNPAEPLRLKK
jgi:IS30 family transposase